MSLKNLPLGVFAALAFVQAQTPHAPAFEVASIKPNLSTEPSKSNFPLGPGDVYVRNGGRLSATGFPLTLYLAFAYKLIGNQSQFVNPQLPVWANTERWDIEARAAGDPSKDDMRLMMRALLAERFQLATHYDTREVPVFAFVLVKNGKLGSQLKPHVEGPPCPTEQPSANAPPLADGLPAFCNGIFPLTPSAPGRYRFGARNIKIGFIADTFSSGVNMGRPMVDETGLDGTFDFTLEWTPDRPDSDVPGANFEEALREQLGIKLAPRKSPMKILVIDHVDRPTAN